MVNFEENYHFSRFQRGPTFSSGGGGGVQLFPRGSICLYPIETHITCDFPGGSGPPDPPLDSHLLSRSAGDSFSSVKSSLGGIFQFYLNFDRP